MFHLIHSASVKCEYVIKIKKSTTTLLYIKIVSILKQD